MDLHGTEVSSGVQPAASFDEGIVKAVRVGPRPSDTTRVVLDLTSAGTLQRLHALQPVPRRRRSGSHGQGGRDAGRLQGIRGAVGRHRDAGDARGLAFGVDRRRLTRAGSPVPTPAPERVVIPADETIKPAPPVENMAPGATVAPATAPNVEVPLPAKHAAGAAAAAIPPATVIPAPPSENLQGRFSLSRQLGLGISRIVIDPGHGGHDPGAQSKGLNEADLVLDVALRLQQAALEVARRSRSC